MPKFDKNTKYTSFADLPKFTHLSGYRADYPIDHLIDWIDESVREEGLQLEPEFQRGHVWTKRQQIAYIEFLLRGGRTGRDLYFNHPNYLSTVNPGGYNDFVCVDGLQRITAIRAFIQNEIRVFHSYYREFTDSIRLTNNTLHVHINNLQSPKDVMTWYVEINTGGTPHSRSEIQRVESLIAALENKEDYPHA